MRKKNLLSLLMLMLSFCFVSCNDDQNDVNFDNKQSILLSKYPNAQNVNWIKSSDNKYDIAQFTIPRTRNTSNTLDTIKVWFGTNDVIRLIKEEIAFQNLPVDVKESFSKAICRPLDGISNETLLNTRYSNSLVWEIDDVYLLEKDGAISYRIELETTSSIKPEIDMALIYDRQGILLNEYEIMDRDELKPLEIPTNILQWITDHFPNSDVLDYECDIEDHEIEHEIDLLQNNIVIEIELIEVNGMLTIEEIEFNYPNLNSLPEDIRIIAIQKIEDLVNFTLEDICEIEMEIQENGDEEYEIELRNDMSEIEVSIIRDKEGVIK